MITTIDETVILRYLLKDDEVQYQSAHLLISSGNAYTYPEIIARVAVTLRDVYFVPHFAISHAIYALIDDVNIREEDAVKLACRFFVSRPLDFTDSLILARHILRGYKVLSFDKVMLNRLLGT